MTVGKAKAVTPNGDDDQFRFMVPCFNRIDKARIRDQLENDQFFWSGPPIARSRGANAAA